MTEYRAGELDTAVVGAGHAGIEAALASARLGCTCALFTLNLDAVANMPCNPAIGGTGKGQLVRELDALGGEMGIAADAVCLQSRMLNTGKGPAVRSLRMQSDRSRYRVYMKNVLEKCENLSLIQAEIVALRRGDGENGFLWEVVTALGAVYRTKTVIIAAGTYLRGKIHIGEVNFSGGPDGMRSAEGLSASLAELGVGLLRFKTGTPARVESRSIDFSRLEKQDGDEPPTPFSYSTDPSQLHNTKSCYIAWTNERTHAVIRANLHRSPLYGGAIEGVGPRYCPSIEDKVVRFSERTRHQIFVEPVSAESGEMYLQGMSSSLPEDVQLAFLRTIDGFEHIKIMRTAYAIEYDCCDPIQLSPSLEFLDFAGLFGAGQFNGTSGYEEAAAQGFIAGVNAARRVFGKPPFILGRETGYIGTLIDDIVTKGVTDPYRMMTSRCEYRLAVRQDNADLRMTPLGRELGLIGDERWENFLAKRERISAERTRLEQLTIHPSPELDAYLEGLGFPPQKQGIRASELLKRPGVSYRNIILLSSEKPVLLGDSEIENIEIELKYEGYIKLQQEAIEDLLRDEKKRLPPDLDYKTVEGLRLEAREKLNRVKPLSIGQASRISGVTPADLEVLAVKVAGRNFTKGDAE